MVIICNRGVRVMVRVRVRVRVMVRVRVRVRVMVSSVVNGQIFYLFNKAHYFFVDNVSKTFSLFRLSTSLEKYIIMN
jgi:hypothetical protein